MGMLLCKNDGTNTAASLTFKIKFNDDMSQVPLEFSSVQSIIEKAAVVAQ
jgi:hypothetical protein